jgi:hypothetical protein
MKEHYVTVRNSHGARALINAGWKKKKSTRKKGSSVVNHHQEIVIFQLESQELDI